MKKVRPGLLFVYLIIFIFNVSFVPAGAIPKGETLESKIDKLKDNQIIVKFKDNKLSSLSSNYKLTEERERLGLTFKKKLMLSGIEVYEVGKNSDVAEILESLRENPQIEYAEVNVKYSAFGETADDRYCDQWGLRNEAQYIGGHNGIEGIDINMQPVWQQVYAPEQVLVGVLDSGIDINHEDLSNSIYINTKEIPDNRLDDDKNGYIDDVKGWDFANDDKTLYDSLFEDVHGTHVAGIIAAQNNTYGIRGIASNAKLVPLKFLTGPNGQGDLANAIEAIKYAKALGVKIINCSWGGADSSDALKQEIKDSGMLFVCASGNSGHSVTSRPVYPACYDLPNIITVAAVNNRGELSKFSNYGDKVHIAAPGEFILSTFPENGYGFMNGTSMAAPFVTGAAALAKGYWSTALGKDLVRLIEDNTTLLPALKDKVSTSGVLNAYSVLKGLNGFEVLNTQTPEPTETPDIPEQPESTGEPEGTPVSTNLSTPSATPAPDYTPTPVPTAIEDEVVQINNQKIKAFLTKLLDKPDQTELYNKDLKDISVLNASSANLNNIDLKDIQKFKNLQMLDLGNNNITDISSLSTLEELRGLVLSKNSVGSLEALKDLGKLVYLDASSNKQVKAESLKYLNKLKELNLDDTKITNISFLSNLKDSLKYLSACSNGITDMSCLEGFDSLESLYLSQNELKSNGKIRLGNLIILDLSRNEFETLNFGSMNRLKILDLSNNQIEEIKDFNLSDLEYLDLSHNEIDSLDELNELEDLLWLDISYNNIDEINDFSLYDLILLDLSHNKLAKLDGLEDFESLRYLYLNDNAITNVTPLKHLTKLRELSLAGNHINNFYILEDVYDNLDKADFDLDDKQGTNDDNDRPAGGGGGGGGGGLPTKTPLPASTTSVRTQSPTPKPVITEKETEKASAIAYKDIKNHWSEQYINDLSRKGIVTGYSDNSIKPDNDLTRAEIAVILVKSLGLRVDDNAQTGFKDNQSIPDWARPFVKAAVEKGIVKGYSNGTFKPSNSVTRCEMTVMAVRAFNLPQTENKKIAFVDSMLIPDWAIEPVSQACELEIIKGYNNNSFKPWVNVKRSEAFTMICKCLGIKGM